MIGFQYDKDADKPKENDSVEEVKPEITSPKPSTINSPIPDYIDSNHPVEIDPIPFTFPIREQPSEINSSYPMEL